MNNAKLFSALFSALLLMSVASPVMAADPRNGAKLYNIHCSGCHGTNGQGAMPGVPDFTRGLMVADPVLVKTLEEGKGMMPAYRGLLSTQDILDVIAHVRTLQ